MEGLTESYRNTR